MSQVRTADRRSLRLTAFSSGALLVPLAYGAGVVMLAIFITSYLGETWNNTISFVVADGWCNIGAGQGIGAHCFGDFGLAFGHSANPYAAGDPSAANSPLTMLLFRALALLPYNIALFTYEASLLMSSVGVVIWGTRGASQLTRAVAIGLVGIGSLGVLVALDRGNHVILMLPLALWYIVSLKREHWMQATAALVLIGSLKFWGVLLVVGLLAKRQYLRAAGALAATAALIVLPMTAFPGGMSSVLPRMLAAVSDRGYAAAISPYSVSIATMARRTRCLIADGSDCDFAAINLGAPLHAGLTVAVTVFILATAFCCLRFSPLTVLAYVPLAAIGIVAVPEGPAYQCVFSVLAAAIFLRFIDADRAAMSQVPTGLRRLVGATYFALVVALVASIVPLPVWQFHSSSVLTSSFGEGAVFRLANWAVPVTWLVFLGLALLAAIGFRLHQRPVAGRPTADPADTL